MSSCHIVLHGRICGLGGLECVEGLCICKESWHNNLEMDLLNGNLQRSLAMAPCEGYEGVIDGIYAAILAVFVTGLLLHICITRSATQFRRGILTYLGYLAIVIAASLRLLQENEPRFGENLWFTMLLMNGVAGFYIGSGNFLIKHFLYLNKCASNRGLFHPLLLKVMVPRRVRAVTLIGFNLFSVACLMNDLRTKVFLLRISFFVNGLFPCVWMIVTNVTTMKARASFHNFLAENEDNGGKNKNALRKKIQRRMKSTRGIQHVTNIFGAINMFFGWSACFSNTFFYLWSYSLPIFILFAGVFMNLATLFLWKARATRSERSPLEHFMTKINTRTAAISSTVFHHPQVHSENMTLALSES